MTVSKPTTSNKRTSKKMCGVLRIRSNGNKSPVNMRPSNKILHQTRTMIMVIKKVNPSTKNKLGTTKKKPGTKKKTGTKKKPGTKKK